MPSPARPPLASPQLWGWLAIATATGILVWLLSPILTPFLLAAVLAYIFDPLVERLTRHRVPRALAAVLILLLAFAALVALLLVILPVFYTETQLLMERLPGFAAWFNEHVAPWLKARLDLDVQLDAETARQAVRDALAENESLKEHALGSLKFGGMLVLAVLVNVVLVPVVLFYLLRDWPVLVAKVDELIPPRIHGRVRTIASEIDRVLAEWLRGQLLVIVIMSLYYVSALWLVGLDFAVLIGILTGLAVVVPYVGIVLGIVLATVSALLEFGASAQLLWVWGAIGLGQALEGMAITPMIVGERIGLHPVAVIFALLAFGQLFGFVGVLIALPASAALLVGLRHLRAAYLAGPLYGGRGS
jgi:predicted PurR-regulated permease PerM